MKNKIILSILLGISLSSCTRDNINEDQHATYDVTSESLITYAEKELSDFLNTPNVNENNFRLTMQYWQETTYVNESNYDFTNRNVANNIWTDNYVNVLNNLNKAKELISKYQPTPSELSYWPVKKQNQLAIADMMMVFTYQTLVDIHGDIPYTQSLNNAEFPLPVYDNDSDIYPKLITRLKEDLSKLQNGGAFGAGDIVYNGNIGQWKKFGNSLLLKLGIALADVNPALAQAAISDAISGGVITNVLDNAQFSYLSSSPNYSPIYENVYAKNRDDYFAGKPFVDYLNTTSDTRISKYFQDVNGSYIGQVIGQPGEFADFSAPGEFAYTPTTPGNIITATEVAFYLLEASARFGIVGNPSDLYTSAITSSFLEWGLTSADAQNYISNHPYDAANWKKSIGEQAWVAMYNQPLISWNFYRRLDYPQLQAPSTANPNAEGKVPVRLQYPTLEATTNGTNYSNASTAIGGDKLTTKVFWDKF